MGVLSTIAVVGTEEFAKEVASAIRRQPGLELAGLISPQQPFPTSAGLVLSVAAPKDRVGVVRNAVAANVPVVTLPVPDSGESMRVAISTGQVVQVSPLRGFPALETLRAELRQGATGRQYGIFAAYRVRQGSGNLFNEVGLPLIHYVYDLLAGPLTRVQVTQATLFAGEPDAWFVTARAADERLVTLEFAASLPPNAPGERQILIEATGSEAVLRGEPTRQAVTVTGRDGATRENGWWPVLAPGFVTAALAAVAEHDPAREIGFLDLLAALESAARSGQPAEVG